MQDSNKVGVILAAAAVSGLIAGSAAAQSGKSIVNKRPLLIAQAEGIKARKGKKASDSNACHGKNAC
jgi:hypothetical protein